jgi:NADH-quinone oxidoreductase subunit L
MLIPLILLAAGAVLAGLLFEGLFIGNEQAHFWNGAIVNLQEHTALEARHHVPDWVFFAPAAAMLFGLIIAWIYYMEFPGLPARMAARQGPLYLFLYNKWYFDELYDFLFVRPAKRLGTFLWKFGDGKIIDGFGPDGVAAAVTDWTKQIVRLQTGFVYHYAFAMLIGVALLATWFMAGGMK